MCVVVPLNSITGVIYSSTSLKNDDKFWIGGVFCAFLPIIITGPFYASLSSDENFAVFSLLLVIIPPASVMYWSVLAIVHSKSIWAFQFLTAFLCITLLIPIGYLFPLYMVDAISLATFVPVAGILL